MSYQRFECIGNLTRDPELREVDSKNGKLSVTEISVAVNEKVAGVKQTEFFDFTVWGNTADFVSEYCSKGQLVFVEGVINKETWETNGEKRSRLKFTATRVRMLSAGKKAGAQDSEKPAVESTEEIPF